MNIFATDYPIDSEFPDLERPVAWLFHYVWKASAITIVLWPVLTGLFWFLNVADHPETTDYAIDPFWMVALGALFYSFSIAIIGLSLYGVARKRRSP